MRSIDLETGGPVWKYRPGSDQGKHGSHKNSWRGHDRIVLIGPRGQEVLRPWLRLNVTEYLFQPCEAVAARNEERRQRRKTPMTPSQARRCRKSQPRRRPGTRYTPLSYAAAVATGGRSSQQGQAGLWPLTRRGPRFTFHPKHAPARQSYPDSP